MSKNHKAPREGFPSFATGYDQAVAILGENGLPCSVAHLKAAKKQGIKAFRSARIYFEDSLWTWLDANPFEPPLPDVPDGEDSLEPKEILERRKLREQFLKARHARLVEEKKYIALAEFNARAAQAMAQFRASLNGLRSDAPQWSGLPPHEILRRVTDKTDAGFRELEATFRKLANG